MRHWRAQSIHFRFQLMQLQQIDARRKENYDVSFNGEIPHEESSDELSGLCDRDQKIIWSAIPEMDGVSEAVDGLADCLKVIGGLLGESMALASGLEHLDRGRRMAAVEQELQIKQQAILEKAKRVDELWLESLEAGQKVKEVMKELGESEDIGFSASDVVGPIFSSNVDYQAGSSDGSDDIDVDAEAESDDSHTYPPPPGTVEKQLHGELLVAADDAVSDEVGRPLPGMLS